MCLKNLSPWVLMKSSHLSPILPQSHRPTLNWNKCLIQTDAVPIPKGSAAVNPSHSLLKPPWLLSAGYELFERQHSVCWQLLGPTCPGQGLLSMDTERLALGR